MICLDTVEKYCKEYWLIENYQEAVNDTTQIWDCHHRHEIDWVLPKEELIAIGRYYDVHYSELIFLTHREHTRLHQTGKEGYWKGKVGPNKGKEGYWKGKVGPNKGKEGENNPNYKYHITEDELYELYIVQDLSTNNIAEMYGCSNVCVWNKLKKYNIIKNGR